MILILSLVMSKLINQTFGHYYQNLKNIGNYLYPVSMQVTSVFLLYLPKLQNKLRNIKITNLSLNYVKKPQSVEYKVTNKNFGNFGHLIKTLVFTGIDAYQNFKYFGEKYQYFSRLINRSYKKRKKL